jgi:hypothetical protein
MLRLIFWIFIILIIFGVISGAIDFSLVEDKLIISVYYNNFINSSIELITGVIDWIASLFDESQPIIEESAKTVSQ